MAAATSNTRQLRENLANYEAQLHQVGAVSRIATRLTHSVVLSVMQVEAALTNDPDNEELLKLKEDLTVSRELHIF